MRGIGFRVAAVVTLLLVWAPGAEAVPTIAKNPASIATDHTGSVQIDIGNVAGSSAILRLYVDANGNGSIDGGDEAIWTVVIPDDSAPWSPAMPSDSNGTTGAITVDVRAFTPFEFPYSAGTFIWEAEDTGDGSTQTTTFSVTQAAQVQSVTGTVTDASNMQPIPGALAALLQFCDVGEEAERFYSAFTNASGQFDIEVPGDLDCYKRVVVAITPGYVLDLLGQPLLTFTGTSNFTGQDVALAPGTQVVSGKVIYSSGPETGNGIPGMLMFADSLGFPAASVAFADINGDYTFMLTDGDWEISEPEGHLDSHGVMRRDTFEEFTVSGSMVSLPTISMPAADAFLQGILTDKNGVALGGRFVDAEEISPCVGACGDITTVTDSLGAFTLGVDAPTGPAQGEYRITVGDPLPGEVAPQISCNFLSAGDTTGGIALQHLAPTGFITGTLFDADSVPTPGFCVDGWGTIGGCTTYTSNAVTQCDGSYSLPVVDGSWSLQIENDSVAGFYGDYSETSAGRFINIPVDDPDGVDFILGPSRFQPHILGMEPTDPQPGERVLIEGWGFSLGTLPTVMFDATPAAIVDFRPDLGFIFVDVPGGLSPGNVNVTVTNEDIGLTSDPYCLDVTAGPYVPACSITGTVSDGGGALGGVSMFAIDLVTDRFGGHAISDGSGNYSIGLPAAGDYDVYMAPPEGDGLQWANYQVTCGNVQNHMFATGFEITGFLTTPNGDSVEGSMVQIEDTGSGYFAQVLTDGDGAYLLIAPAGNYGFSFNAPPGGRILQAPGFPLAIAGNTDVGQNVAPIGSFFAGRVVDVDGEGVPARVIGYDTSLMQRSGDTGTNSCDGRFAIGLPFDEFQLEIEDIGAGLFQNATVKTATIAGDRTADFDFTVFDAAINPALGPEPQILFVEPGPAGQAGQPLIVDVSNIGGTTVDVLFSDGVGGFVAGTSTDTEPERGLLATRIPAGAADGSMKVRVDMVDSELLSFTRVPGTFPAGIYNVSGTVTGPGNANAFVALAWFDPSTSDCDGDPPIVDYGRTDGSGNYGPLTHPGGDIAVFILPDAASTGAVTMEIRNAVMSHTTVDATIPAGVAVDARVVDAFSNPVPNAVFEVGDDLRRTDSNGDATVYVAPGDYEVFVVPPSGLRLFEYEDMMTITMATDLGDLVLDDGSMVSSAVLREDDGSPIGGVFMEGQRSEDPFDFWFETYTGADGSFAGPIAGSTLFQVSGEPADATLSNLFRQETSGPDTDCILHPAFESRPAGAIAGLLRDATSLTPLPEISAYAVENVMGGPGNLSGFTQSCDDGTYNLKVPEGSHWLRFDDFNNGQYGAWYDDESCFGSATPVSVTEGNTTNIDADLLQFGTITGTVYNSAVPVPGATVCTQSLNGGSCQTCTQTDGAGVYILDVPPETDYRVEAFSMLGSQCYDDIDFCAGFTPVVVTTGMTTSGIDFNFGCTMGDADMDGVSECAGDCDDGDPLNFPGNTEVCDGQDNDCDFLVDDADPGVMLSTWYIDSDLDNFGDPGTTQQSCTQPGGYADNDLDCDDSDGTVYPDAPEGNDGIDNQCPGDLGHGQVDEISGMAGFFNPGDSNEFSWPAQAGAGMYRLARSDGADFPRLQLLLDTPSDFYVDGDPPGSGETFYYLVRSTAPFAGSWGASPAGPRGINVIDDSDLEAWSSPTDLTTWFETTAAGTVEQETNAADVHEQMSAARITRSVAGAINIQKRQVSLRPGYDHAVVLQAKFDQVFSQPLFVRIFNFTTGDNLQSDGTTWAAAGNSFFFDLTTGYQEITLPFTFDAGFSPADDIRLIVGHRGGTPNGSILWLDDVRVEER